MVEMPVNFAVTATAERIDNSDSPIWVHLRVTTCGRAQSMISRWNS